MTTLDLYHFDFADGPDYYYTSAEHAVLYDGEEWLPAPITRNPHRVETDGRTEIDSAQITVDRDTSVTDEFLGPGPTREVRLDIYSADRHDIVGTVELDYPGVLVDITRDGKEVTWTASPRKVDTEKKVPRGRYSTRCRWSVYGPGCDLDISDFQETTDLTSIDLTQREVFFVLPDELDDNFFVGGTLDYDGVGRRITSQEGPDEAGDDWLYTVRLQYWIAGLESGDTVDVAPGCPFDPDTCEDRFDNLANFGGLPMLQHVKSSPFGGVDQ